MKNGVRHNGEWLWFDCNFTSRDPFVGTIPCWHHACPDRRYSLLNRLIMLSMMVMCAMTTGASAAPLPDAPSASRGAKPPNVYLSPFRDPWFYAGTLTAASGIIADVHFVQSCERDKTCYELNPGADTYKRRLPEVGLVTLGAYGCSLMLHDHKWWRAVCAVGPVALGLYHWRDTKITYLRGERVVRP